MRTLCTILLAVTLVTTINGQTNDNYWSHQFGAHGLLLNGAIISSSRDETSLFYNPGAITLDANLGFAFSFITPTYTTLTNENFLGNNQTLSDNDVGFSPGFLAVRFRPFKSDKIVAGASAFKRFQGNIQFQDRITDRIDSGTVFVFRSDLDFSRERSEDWFGLSIGYKLSDKLGIGISQFSVWHGQDLELDFTKEILFSNRPTSLVQSWRSTFDYDVSVSNGWITKVGMTYAASKFSAGLTLTTPLYGVARSRASYSIDDQRISLIDTLFQVTSNRRSLDNATVKSPLSVGLGFDYGFKQYRIYMSTEYFWAIENYTIFSDTNSTFQGATEADSEFTVNISTGNISVLNFAVGLEYFKNDKLTILGGFRTDHNQNNTLFINDSAQFLDTTPSIFHVSGGVLANYGSSVLSVGLDLAYGLNQDGQQLTDLSNITSDNIFTFSGDNSVRSQFFSFSLFLTYDFIFDRITKSHKEKHQ
jgi:hypothetical protein